MGNNEKLVNDYYEGIKETAANEIVCEKMVAMILGDIQTAIDDYKKDGEIIGIETIASTFVPALVRVHHELND